MAKAPIAQVIDQHAKRAFLAQELSEARAEIARLRDALARLGSMEAFDVGTCDVPDEVKMRIDYARAALKPNKEADNG